MAPTTITTNRASVFDRPSTKALIVAVFTALSLATDYAMTGFQNIKVMDTLVFLVAFLFGFRLGIGVALLTRFIYGIINPFGPADPITLVFVMIGECFFAIAGGALRGSSVASGFPRGSREYERLTYMLFVVGLLATFAFDVLTNFASLLFRTSSLYQALIVGNIFGAPFAVAHEGSNAFFFAFVAPAVIVAATRLGLSSRRSGHG
jgi:uncharacterized membrane protein